MRLATLIATALALFDFANATPVPNNDTRKMNLKRGLVNTDTIADAVIVGLEQDAARAREGVSDLSSPP